MALQRAPGVYFETTDPPPRGVSEVRTDVAGFVGVSGRGPLHQPVRVESWTQFLTRFGGPIPEGFLAYAVKGFFANGGAACWVVRVGVPPLAGTRASLVLANTAKEAVFRVYARDDGPATERISVRVEQAVDDRFNLTVEVDGEAREVSRDLQPTKFEPKRNPDEKTTRPSARYVCDLIGSPEVDSAGLIGLQDQFTGTRSGSVLVAVEDLANDPNEVPAARDAVRKRLPVGVRSLKPNSRTFASVNVWGVTSIAGDDPFQVQPIGYLGIENGARTVLGGLTLEHFTGENQLPDVFLGLKTLERIEEVSIVAMPDLIWPGYPAPPPHVPRRRPCSVLPVKPPVERPKPLGEEREGFKPEEQRDGQLALLKHCATLKDRFAVLDAPAQLEPDNVRDWANLEVRRSEAGQYGGIYYPWIYVPEPLPGPSVRLVPPSGHVAGVYARVDLSVGVQKPPANEAIEECAGVEVELSPDVHGWLNDEGINVIRPYPGRGVRVMGDRTLVPPGDAEMRPWRYIHVRRLVMMIEESIDRSAQWLVFEPNRPEKWREVDRVVRFFIDDLWRQGRFDGASADEAYSVTCDETTNPDSEIALGKMICEVGIKPPDPAEFVIVRLGRRVGETGVVQFGRPDDA